MVTMSEAHPVRRSTSNRQAPCFVLRSEGSHVRQRKEDTMKDLVARTHGVSTTAQEIKDYITKILLTTKSKLPTGNFLPTEDFTVTEEKIKLASTNFVSALKGHYILLSKLVSHTEHAKTNGKIGERGGNETLKAKLQDIENQLYQIMCDMKIALLGQGADANIFATNHKVSPAFKSGATSQEKETLRAYVLMNDFQDIMEFLKKMSIFMN